MLRFARRKGRKLGRKGKKFIIGRRSRPAETSEPVDTSSAGGVYKEKRAPFEAVKILRWPRYFVQWSLFTRKSFTVLSHFAARTRGTNCFIGKCSAIFTGCLGILFVLLEAKKKSRAFLSNQFRVI